MHAQDTHINVSSKGLKKYGRGKIDEVQCRRAELTGRTTSRRAAGTTRAETWRVFWMTRMHAHTPHAWIFQEYSQGQVVEAYGPQGEGSGQQAHVCEKHSDGLLKVCQLLKHRRRLDQLSVGLGLLDLTTHTHTHTHGFEGNVLPVLGHKRSVSCACSCHGNGC